MTTIFTGKYPMSHGLRHHANRVTEAEKSYTTSFKFLPEILREQDYVTIALDWLGRWHKRGYDFYGGHRQTAATAKKQYHDSMLTTVKKHFSRISLLPGRYSWYYKLPFSAREKIRYATIWWNCLLQSDFSRKSKPVLSDSAGLSDFAVRYIKEYAGRKNFFLFIHYWDNHIPYTAPQSLVKAFLRDYEYPTEQVSSIINKLRGTPAEDLIYKTSRSRIPETVGEIMALYDASIKYVDSNIGRIYATLEELSLVDDTLLIITADHGESLTEHDIFFDHHGLYDPEVRVPIIMSHSTLPKGAVYNDFVQHFDLTPTIMDIGSIQAGEHKMDGQSLMKLIRDKSWDRRFVYAEERGAQKKRMIRDTNYKYIKSLSNQKCYYCKKHHCEGDEFYDLQADPQEINNIIHDPKHKDYKDEMERYIESLSKPREGKKVEFEDEKEVHKRLKSLGYL